MGRPLNHLKYIMPTPKMTQLYKQISFYFLPVHLRTDFHSSCAIFVKYRPAPAYEASRTDLVICFEFYVSMWCRLLIYLMLADLCTMEEKPWFSTMIFKKWIGNSFVQTYSKLIWRRVSAISGIFHTHKIWSQMPGKGQKWPSPETNKVKKFSNHIFFLACSSYQWTLDWSKSGCDISQQVCLGKSQKKKRLGKSRKLVIPTIPYI